MLILTEKSFIHTYPSIHLHPIPKKRAGYNDRVGEDGLQLLLRFGLVRFGSLERSPKQSSVK
jgi:hypothetical protein